MPNIGLLFVGALVALLLLFLVLAIVPRARWRLRPRRLAFLALLSAFLAIPACNHQTPEPGTPTVGSRVLDCGQDVVAKCASQSLGPINTCLASAMDDPMGCLTGLIGPGVCAAEVVIGCLTNAAGATAAREAPGNAVSARMSDRAAAWIKLRGYTFKGAAPTPSGP